MTTMNRVTPAGKFRLASNLDERAEELEHIFPGGRPGGRNAIDGVALAELLGQRHS